MSNVVNNGRQWPLVLEQVIDFTDFNGVAVNSAVQPKLPQGAIVLRGGVFVETAFGLGAACDIGNAGNGAAYLNDLDLNVVGFTAFTGGLGLKSSGETILIAPDAEAKAATAGKARLIVEYILTGRATENQP